MIKENIFSIFEDISNAPINDVPKDPFSFYYYCPKCFKLPSIKILKNYVEIECSCSTKKEERQQLPNEDITKPEVLLELAEYKKYRILLKSYLQLIELNSKSKKTCELQFTQSDKKAAEIYCLNCDPQLFMCDSCSITHDIINPKHKKIKSAGMKISEICEKNECEKKGIIGYYCLNCKVHLCIGCIANHKNHSIINLKSFIDENKNSLKMKDKNDLFIEKLKIS